MIELTDHGPIGLVDRAMLFAATAHTGQTREYTEPALPYMTHCAAVADLLRAAGADDATVAAGYLHDVVEDTKTTHEELVALFGTEVATLVAEVTNVSQVTKVNGTRAARKALDLAHVAKASPRGKTIKLADIIDNAATIVERNPKFAKLYLTEKLALLPVLTEGDPTLLAMATATVEGNLLKLEERP